MSTDEYGRPVVQTLEAWIADGDIVPAASPTVDDLWDAAQWLGSYECEDDSEFAQALATVHAWLLRKAAEKNRRAVLAEAKRRYAEQHGIPVSKVRVNR